MVERLVKMGGKESLDKNPEFFEMPTFLRKDGVPPTQVAQQRLVEQQRLAEKRRLAEEQLKQAIENKGREWNIEQQQLAQQQLAEEQRLAQQFQFLVDETEKSSVRVCVIINNFIESLSQDKRAGSLVINKALPFLGGRKEWAPENIAKKFDGVDLGDLFNSYRIPPPITDIEEQYKKWKEAEIIFNEAVSREDEKFKILLAWLGVEYRKLRALIHFLERMHYKEKFAEVEELIREFNRIADNSETLRRYMNDYEV